MTDSVQELAERGRALRPEDRARLVDLLIETLEDTASPEVAKAWDKEIERRIAAHQAGEVETYDLDEVLLEARRLAP